MIKDRYGNPRFAENSVVVFDTSLNYDSELFEDTVGLKLKEGDQELFASARDHWDFGSVASLLRNLAEAYLWYYWLCIEEVGEDESDGRFISMYLHDYGSRKKTFGGPIELAGNTLIYDDLVGQFESNPYLKSFDENRKKVALKGESTPFIQDDVLDKLDLDKADFRMIYRFFSNHTHTGPMSFYRMVEHDRGSGIETRQEKKYMIIAINFGRDILERAIAGHLRIFPDAEARTPPLNWPD